MTQRLRLSEAVPKFLLHLQACNLAPTTIDGYRSTLALFARVTGDLRLDSIRAEHVDAVFNHYHWAQSTRNIRIGQFRAFFTWARGAKHMSYASNPMVGRRYGTVPDKQRIRIPHAEWPRLFEACVHPQERIVVATGLYLFLRASEQKDLRLHQVNLQDNVVELWRRKTKKWQTMPIVTELDHELRIWLTYLSENYSPTPDSHLVCAQNRTTFKDPVTGRWASGTGTLDLSRPMHSPALAVQRILRRAGYTFDKYTGEHTLRRSGARALFDSLVDQGYDGALRQVQTMLGHKSSSQTEVYIGIDLDQKKVLQAFAGKPMFARVSANVMPLREVVRG